MKKSVSTIQKTAHFVAIKKDGELNALEFKVARLSSRLAKMIKNYRELTEMKGIPAESVEAVFMESKIQSNTRKLAELIASCQNL